MELVVVLLCVASCFMKGECAETGDITDATTNLTDPSKDMYVIHATVYQVGILTNRTENMTDNFNATGNVESLTLYHSNGTDVDLSGIPEPFLTNITAHTLVGVAPIPENMENNKLRVLNQLTNSEVATEKPLEKRSVDSLRDVILRLFKRNARDESAKIESGTAVIPSDAGIHSISLPPLLALNNNLTEIPVPIPNTSVVHYAKINTVVQKP